MVSLSRHTPSACPTYCGNCRSGRAGITDFNPVGKEGALRTVRGLRALLPAATNSSHLSPSRSRPHLAPLTSLAATLMDSPANYCKHKAYGRTKPFRCNTYTKLGGGYSCQFWKGLRGSATRTRFLFKFFLFTLLRTLLRSPKAQLFYFQSIPHSWPKTTRVGGLSPESGCCLWILFAPSPSQH